MNNNFANRLQIAMDNMKISQSELSEKTGISKASICEYLSGAYEPKQRNTYKLATALNVKPSYLMGVGSNAPQPSTPVSSDGWLAVPISGKAACGEPIEDPSAWDETFYIPPDLAHGHEAHDFLVIRAKGESMEPKILDGDILVFLREYSSEITEPCAVYIEGEGYTVKKVRYDANGNISLIANNADAYEPHTYTPEEAEAIGLTVHGYLVRMERRNF